MRSSNPVSQNPHVQRLQKVCFVRIGAEEANLVLNAVFLELVSAMGGAVVAPDCALF